MNTILIHSQQLNDAQHTQIENTLQGTLHKKQNHFRIESSATQDAVQTLSDALRIDINILPKTFNGNTVKLIISDMDSTLISIECIDEIADFIGVKPQVSAITEQAMRGELDFNQSLTQRVSLLEGLNTDALDRVYEERLTLNPGAEKLINESKTKGIQFALVSGGFTYFTEKLKTRLGLDFTRANVLEIHEHALTGKVMGDIINAEAKAIFLKELCQELQIKPEQTIAMGDGANDLEMMHIAGLSVAYRAKPAVQAQADIQINYGGLDLVLDFLG